MPQEHKVSTPTPEDLKKVLDAINVVNSVLKPHLISLTPSERHELPRMNDGTVPFVQKTLECTQAYVGFVPAYLNIQKLRNDFNVVEALAQILKPVEELYQRINDTMTLSGSEAFVASLDIYMSIKQSAKVKVPGAKAIAADLKKYCDGQVKNRYELNCKVTEFRVAKSSERFIKRKQNTLS
jgi:hypothetical protein